VSIKVRIPKSEMYEDTLHEKPFLYWIQEQTERIARQADVIQELKTEGVRAVVPARVHEAAATFTEFYVKNVSFKHIYEEFKETYDEEAKELYDNIYLDIKREVADHTKGKGVKYKKKEATEKEIKMEMRSHSDYSRYEEVLKKVRDYEKKIKAQDDYIKGLGKLDSILRMLQNAMEKELKYLCLET